MKRRQQGRSIEERYKTACGNRLVCLIGVGILLILPVLGYVFHKWLSEELSFPSSEEWAYMPLNFGTYGLMGVLAILIVVLIVCTIKVLIHSIPGTGFTLFGCLLSLGATILFYGLCVSVGMGVFTCLYHLYQKIEPAIDFMIFDIHIEGGNPVFGPAGTMGVALLSTILYGALLLAVLTGAMINWMRVRKLKLPAMEERRVREEKERAAEAERIRQKQLKKERKEQEEKERREYERFILAQARAAKADTHLGEYSFFEGCTTREQAAARLEKMLGIYDTEDGSGDPMLARVIRNQYQGLIDRLDQPNRDRTST